MLSSQNVTFTQQFFVNGFSYDFKVGNTIIEVNGDYWHCNPIKYKYNDIVNFPLSPKLVQDVWDKDKRKRDAAIKRNFSFETIWESELTNMTDAELDVRIREILCKNQ